jgi:undecaprenyl-diphosphatase
MRRRRKRAANAALPVRHAVALGILHGPTELLPVSSSAHITLVPWLARWPYAGLDAELRKAFEVALHAGTAAALLIGLHDEVGDAVRGFDRRRAILVAGSFIPPAIVGFTLERPIERRLGTPATIAIGLLAGSAAMALADRLGPTGRSRHDAGPADALWLGLAQACALMPGASRNGMTLAAARARGFGREDANALSRHVALPIIVGATVLKGTRLARRGLPAGTSAAFAAGVAASFASTLASTWLIRQVERDRSLAPYAAYRTVLALAVLIRLCGTRMPDRRFREDVGR